MLLQDSTTVKLPPHLATVFPGSRKQCGAAHGQLRIECLYELRAQRFVSFRLSGFNRNDQAAAPDVLPVLRAGDLALLGWAIFVTNVPPTRWSAPTVARVYGLRWRIETLFKTWKSHFGVTVVPRGTTAQLVLSLAAWGPLQPKHFLRQLRYHGRYECRRRKHFAQTLLNLS